MCIFYFAPNIAHADNPYEQSNDACTVAGVNDPLICGTKGGNEEKELQNRVKNILDTIYAWIGIIAVIVIVIGGIQYMVSAGDAQKIKTAKSAITYAIIGLIVTLMAFAITNFVIGTLDGKGAGDGGTVAEGGGGTGGGGTPSDGGSSGEAVEVRSLKTATKTTLIVGQDFQLKVLIIPDYAKDHTLTFTSGDTSIATVSETGKVTAVKDGQTDITITAKNGVHTSTHIVVIKPVQVDSITLKPTSLEMNGGEKKTITATIKPSNAADKTITWTSSNTKIATVSSKGVVKALTEGTTTITAKSSNGKEAKVKVLVGFGGLKDENGKLITYKQYIAHAKRAGDYVWDSHNKINGQWIYYNWHNYKIMGGDINAYTQMINILWYKDYITKDVYNVVVKNNPEWKTKTKLFFFDSKKSNDHFKVDVEYISRTVDAIKKALAQGKVVAGVTNSNRWRDNKGNHKEWSGGHWGVIFQYDGKYFHMKGGGSRRISDGIYTEKQLKEWLDTNVTGIASSWRRIAALSRRK